MIKTKQDLKEALKVEAVAYGMVGGLRGVANRMFHGSLTTGRYVRLLRYTEYYHNNSYHKTGNIRNILNDLLYVYYHHKYETLGAKLGLEIGLNSCDVGAADLP